MEALGIFLRIASCPGCFLHPAPALLNSHLLPQREEGKESEDSTMSRFTSPSLNLICCGDMGGLARKTKNGFARSCEEKYGTPMDSSVS